MSEKAKKGYQQLKKNSIETTELFRVLTEHALVGVYLIQDNVFKYVNPKLAEIFGYTPDELIEKKGPKDLAYPEDRPRVEKNIRKRIKGEAKKINYSFRGLKKNGEVFEVEVFGSRVMYKGKPAIIGTLLDITERKKTEEALRESEEKYRAIFENTGTATTIIEEDTTISLANQEFEKLSGYKKEEIEGKKSWTEFVSKEDLERMKKYHYLRRINPHTAPRNYEFRFIDKEGNVKDIFLTVDMIPGTKKSVASLQDITKLKQTERALIKRLETERALAKLAEELVKARCVASAVNKALSLLGKVFDADRVLLFEKREEKDIWDNTHEWRREGVSSVKENLQGLSPEKFPWWEKRIKTYRPIVICDLNKLPAAKSILKIFKTKDAKSLLAIPILLENKLTGLIALCTTRECRTWEEVDTHILQAAGEITLTSLAKERLQKKLALTLKSLEIERKWKN